MPDDAGRDAAFYDHESEPRRHVADWGGDELFTRMPGRREVHVAPPPRFRRPAPVDPVHRAPGEVTGRFRRDDDRPRPVDPRSAEERWAQPGDGAASLRRAAPPPFERGSVAHAGGPGARRTVVISGHPAGAPRPPVERRRPPRTVAERVGPRPERIVGWAFALGLLLILIAIATADAAVR